MCTYIPRSPPSCVSLPPSLSHPSRWSQSTELISLCYAAASHYLSILHLVVYIYPCHSLTSSHVTLLSPHVLKSILYVCVFIPLLSLGSSETFFFLRFYMYVLTWYLFFSFWLTSLWMTDSRSIHLTTKKLNFISFYGWVIFHCIYVPHLLYPFICRWTLRLLPCPGYCK